MDHLQQTAESFTETVSYTGTKSTTNNMNGAFSWPDKRRYIINILVFDHLDFFPKWEKYIASTEIKHPDCNRGVKKLETCH